MQVETHLEHKFMACKSGLSLTEGQLIEGYASRFGEVDQCGDVVLPGAYGNSLEALAARGSKVKMLWQHDPAQPIGVWDEVREDTQGLRVKGRLLVETRRGAEAAALIAAGAIDGLSIGYRTKCASKGDKGERRLSEVELWEVSLVTFPMLPTARVTGKSVKDPVSAALRDMAAILTQARTQFAKR
ncbi:HK97 family phage prohead protease [Parasedimentitalea marina]|uniref:HK97 family phage prohead protease n=1 Tax=Parasedimentitalea marina TaxID=2483033 RepID=A0A3T0N3J7_9RHOB|nr:HK97 family phage prohead protease [Parasedimentitalea marina]AZV78564.1 HK97 family phage prohead protease [Parasedimentitalea marina]